ncbi:MAG: VOC family protein [Flavobacteriales bacterium]|nr:MAG: VOC family protein [Flavobacteriales bacterium]
MVKFGYTILYVADVSKSISFYENAFGFNRKFITPENDYGELATGDTTISFASLALANTNLKAGFVQSDLAQKPFAIELGFITEDVAAVVKNAITQGATLVEEPKTKPWGQTVAYVRDLEGFLIEICSPMG